MNDPENFFQLNLIELERFASTWAEEYPIIEKITLYSGKIPPHSEKEPKTFYVFIVRSCKRAHRKDAEYQNYKDFIEWTSESCMHIQNELERVYKEASIGYHLEWAWFNLEPDDELPTEFISLKYPWILYERDDQPCSAASTVEPSTVEPSTMEPSTVEPSTVEPSTVEPSIVEPSIAEPSSAEPSSAELSSVEDIDDFPENHINSFTLEGYYWVIRFGGNKIIISDSKGIRYIIHMLEYPNKEFYVNDLLNLVKGHDPTVNQDYSKMDAEQLENEGLSLTELQIEKLSPEDKSGIEDVIYNLWGELIKAEKLDGEKHVKAQEEWDKMVKSLLRDYGLSVYPSAKGPKFNYKPRWKKDIQNARVAVKNNINRATKGLRPKIPALAEYLDKNIYTGGSCVYRPDFNDPIEWVIHW